MSNLQSRAYLSHEDYLQGEQHSDIRHEYIAGQVYAMVGTTRAHNIIAGNMFAFLHQHLRGKPCTVFISDMKVRVEIVDAYYYPDVMVSCETTDAKALAMQEPRLIIEVLSPSTEHVDRREKYFAYQTLAHLQEYILVSQDKSQVEVFRRQKNQSWQLETYADEEMIQLSSVAAELPMTLIYEGL